ncbi:MAG: DUF1275 domain-containing protein [Clostridiales bacterium]|nr:DUF1275 domain-containing protein [Clostridiales bacterium]
MSWLRAARREAGALWILMVVLLAGALNAAGWLRFGQTLSHMTGNLTKLGLMLAGGGPALLIGGFLLAFFLGATVSGYAFPAHSLGLWQRSGFVLLTCGGLLLVLESLPFPDELRMVAAAGVLGAQNGLALRYRGILTRTTHMTGHLTDCGAALGRMLHSRRFAGEDMRLFLFHLLCLVFFALGVVLTAAAAPRLQDALGLDAVVPVAFCYMLAGALTLFKVIWHRWHVQRDESI